MKYSIHIKNISSDGLDVSIKFGNKLILKSDKNFNELIKRFRKKINRDAKYLLFKKVNKSEFEIIKSHINIQNDEQARKQITI